MVFKEKNTEPHEIIFDSPFPIFNYFPYVCKRIGRYLFIDITRGNPVRIRNCTLLLRFQNFSLYCHCLAMDGKGMKRNKSENLPTHVLFMWLSREVKLARCLSLSNMIFFYLGIYQQAFVL